MATVKAPNWFLAPTLRLKLEESMIRKIRAHRMFNWPCSYTTKYTFGEASQDHPIQLAIASNLTELSSRIVEKTLSSEIASNDSYSCSNPGFDFPNLPSLRLIVTRVNLRFAQAESAKRITPMSKLHLRISLRWDIETEFFFREIIVFVDSTEFTHCKRPTW